MAIAPEKLAASLEALEALQSGGTVAIRSTDLTRTHRERLLNAGFIREVMKGWYMSSRPDEAAGESTAWYTSFWHFIAQYFHVRFGEAWSLSPEQSLVLLSGNRTVPAQLMVRAPNARNGATDFPHGTSVFEARARIAEGGDLTSVDNMRVFTLEAALILVSDSFFANIEM